MPTTVPKKLTVRQGYALSLSGVPDRELRQASVSQTVAVLPSQIPFIKPKALVKEGDRVQIGTPLFLDKSDPRVQVLSPGSGRVSRVVFGERRRLDVIQIALELDESSVSFSAFTAADLAEMSRDLLVDTFLNRGLWALLRERPFGNIPSPDVIPPGIYVSLDVEDAFLPQPQVVLSGQEEAFRVGIAALKGLADGRVFVAVHRDNLSLKQSLGDVITHEIKGPLSSNGVGVFHYHAKISAADNKAWTVGLGEVIRIGETLLTGRYATRNVVTVSGIMTAANGHFVSRVGAPVASFLKPADTARYIAGSVLSGRRVDAEGYLALDESALVALPEGREQQFLSFVQPGFDKYSFSRAFLSVWFPKKQWTVATTLNGSHRACIECGVCDAVCPVEVLPQWIMKQVEAKDQEEAVSMGLLDCTACGLCTYVCPSKIEVSDILTGAKNKIFKELRS